MFSKQILYWLNFWSNRSFKFPAMKLVKDKVLIAFSTDSMSDSYMHLLHTSLYLTLS